jgi:hypothetical protein
MSFHCMLHDPVGHFGWNGSNFLGHRLLKTFQNLGMMFVYLGFEVAKEKKNRMSSSKRYRPHTPN